MKVLDKITVEEAKLIVPDKGGIEKLKKDELIFKIADNLIKTPETDELVDIEIALRQCERTGFFRN